jgi:putative transposase
VLSVRRLPHIYPEDRWLFLTWHLQGAAEPGQFPPPGKVTAGRAFVWMDRCLDTTRFGPQYLRQDAVADAVAASLERGVQLAHYELAAFAIMPNHVHVLLLPRVEPSKLMRSLKSASAREANRLLGQAGKPFWQRESYDHYVRSPEEWNRIVRYIENNPVKAGLSESPERYPWCSAHARWRR